MYRSTTGSALPYFALTLAFSAPFYILGALATSRLLPGLPLSALGVLSPAVAAALLTFRRDGLGGVSALLKRAIDPGAGTRPLWYFPTLLLMPLVMAFSFFTMRALGSSIPAPHVVPGRSLALFVAFLVGALAEELGWSGYATDPLQERFGPLTAALLIGAVSAIWHVIPLLEVQRSWGYITWWSLGTVANRLIIVQLYNATGRSVFAAALYHAMVNLSWQLFPIEGSFYDPAVTSPIVALAACLLLVSAAKRLRRAT